MDFSSYLARQIEERSALAGRQIRMTAENMRATAGQLRSNPNTVILSDLAARGADAVDRVGLYLQETPLDRMIADAELLGRRQPWIVATAGLVTGVVAARLVKSTAARRRTL